VFEHPSEDDRRSGKSSANADSEMRFVPAADITSTDCVEDIKEQWQREDNPPGVEDPGN